jgi:hypothetical protein
MPIFSDLTEEWLHGVFQQDTATTHMAHASLEALCEAFGDHVISDGLWSTCSPNLTSCGFYLWLSLKYKVYKRNPHTLEEQRNNIHHKISTISGEELLRVNTNMLHRYTESEGQHFQHLP